MAILSKRARKTVEKSYFYGLSLWGREHIDFRKSIIDPWVCETKESDIEYFDLLIRHDDKSAIQNRIYLNSFEWLRNFKNDEDFSKRLKIREMIEYWIRHAQGIFSRSWATDAWYPDVMGYRIWNWIVLFDWYGNSGPDSFQKLIIGSLTQQYRQLSRSWDDDADPLVRLRALKGIIGFLSVSSRSDRIKKWLNVLTNVIDSQFLADGGHISQNPKVQLYVLRDLIDIRAVLASIDDPKVEEIRKKISQIASVTRLFRHGDGSIASFVGCVKERDVIFIPSEISASFIDVCLSLSDVGRRPPTQAEEMGYIRCVNKSGIVLLSTRPQNPIQKDDQSTGLFNFEWSYDRQMVISRAETLIESGEICFRAELNENATINRSVGENYIFINAEYSGKDFCQGRQIYLSGETTDIRGEDIFTVQEEASLAIRFILAPDIEVLQSSKTTNTFILKLCASNVNSLKRFTRITTIQFVATGCYDLIYRPADEYEPHSVVLFGTLKPKKPNLIKWAFALNA